MCPLAREDESGYRNLGVLVGRVPPRRVPTCGHAEPWDEPVAAGPRPKFPPRDRVSLEMSWVTAEAPTDPRSEADVPCCVGLLETLADPDVGSSKLKKEKKPYI